MAKSVDLKYEHARFVLEKFHSKILGFLMVNTQSYIFPLIHLNVVSIIILGISFIFHSFFSFIYPLSAFIPLLLYPTL